MTPEQQRIAIAEACGFKQHVEQIEYNDGYQWTETRRFWVCPKGKRVTIPDYLNDLNDMHEAESTIRKDHDKWGIYLVQLCRTAPECRVFATAAQRAEALLRTLNLCKE